MNRFISLILVCLAATGLAGCSNTGKRPVNTDAPIKIKNSNKLSLEYIDGCYYVWSKANGCITHHANCSNTIHRYINK